MQYGEDNNDGAFYFYFRNRNKLKELCISSSVPAEEHASDS